jgi:hypothetical protein
MCSGNFYPVGSVGKKSVSGDMDLALILDTCLMKSLTMQSELLQYGIRSYEWEENIKK